MAEIARKTVVAIRQGDKNKQKKKRRDSTDAQNKGMYRDTASAK